MERFVIGDPLTGEQPLMRLTCRTRSCSRVARSRDVRRRSSCSGVGATTIVQTRGSPRRQPAVSGARLAIDRVGLRAPLPSRLQRTDAGSTTWLSMPFASSSRCTEKPSRPASWMTTTLADFADRFDQLPACSSCQQIEQRRTVAPRCRVFRHLAAAGRQRRHEPSRAAQLQRCVQRRMMVLVVE